MSELRPKLAELPQEEREQLIKEAVEAGFNSTMIANWYVDTLKAKIEAKINGSQKEDKKASVKATPASPAQAEKEPEAEAEKKEAKTPEKTEKTKICHICRGIVKNNKCTECGFEIAKR